MAQGFNELKKKLFVQYKAAVKNREFKNQTLAFSDWLEGWTSLRNLRREYLCTAAAVHWAGVTEDFDRTSSD